MYSQGEGTEAKGNNSSSIDFRRSLRQFGKFRFESQHSCLVLVPQTQTCLESESLRIEP